MNKILSFIVLFLLCLSSVSASVVTRYGSDFKIVGDELFFKVSDRLGSDRLILDDTSIIAESNTLPYGQQLKNNNVKFGFTGKELDATDNYYFNARYYDYDSGKFLGVDPVRDNHAYAYVSNNPMNMVDPSGRDPSDEESVEGGDEYWEIVLMGFTDTKWYDMIRDDIPEINSVSEATGVPAEAVLSAILVEDLRYHAPYSKAALTTSYVKGAVRSLIPNWGLKLFGHQPNPEAGYSAHGMIWRQAIFGAIKYLQTVDSLDEGTKSLLSRVSSSDSQDTSIRYFFSDIEQVALVLKAHMIFWEKGGHDLFNSEFKTIKSQGERIGVLETLNSMFAYNTENLIVLDTNEQVTVGFTTRFHKAEDKPGYTFDAPKRYCVPHDSPGLGGTILWGSISYGEISKIFVDSGLAMQIMESGVGSSIATSDILDQ